MSSPIHFSHPSPTFQTASFQAAADPLLNPITFDPQYSHTAALTVKKINQTTAPIFATAFFPFSLCAFIKHQLHKLMGELIVPAQSFGFDKEILEKGRKALIVDFGAKEVRLKTSDGLEIDGMYLSGKINENAVASNGPTIIYFNGNGGYYELHGLSHLSHKKSSNSPFPLKYSNLEDYLSRGYNVFLFNYRGVSKSQGHVTCRGLTLDGEAAYHFIHDYFKVPNENIILFGHSLGGAIAAQIAVHHPFVQICNERSFSSLAKMIQLLFHFNHNTGKQLTLQILHWLEWEFDSLSVWSQIKGKKWCVYHPRDSVIFTEAGLYENLSLQSRGKTIPATRLIDNHELSIRYQEHLIERFNRPLDKNEIASIDRWIERPYFTHNRALLPCELDEILNNFSKP